MAVWLIFFFGIGNFAIHRAVMESGHPFLGQFALRRGGLGRRLAFASEFLVLLAALGLAMAGWPGVAWAYAVYSMLNAMSAWLILTERI